MNEAGELTVGNMFAGICDGSYSREVFEDWLDTVKLASYIEGSSMVLKALDKTK